MYVDFTETVKSKVDQVKDRLKDEYGTYANDEGSSTSSSYRIKLGERGAGKGDILNFRILKSGARTPTAIQERGSAFIFDLALRRNFDFKYDFKNI